MARGPRRESSRHVVGGDSGLWGAQRTSKDTVAAGAM